jgi:hypothetical protein
MPASSIGFFPLVNSAVQNNLKLLLGRFQLHLTFSLQSVNATYILFHILYFYTFYLLITMDTFGYLLMKQIIQV